jgi:uncharacterized cupredoxin-like copper-binding protein
MVGTPRGGAVRRIAAALAIGGLLLIFPSALAAAGTGAIGSHPLVVHTAAGTFVQMSVGANGALAFTPNAISNVAPGSAVSIEITNLGAIPHTFTLSSLVNYTLPYVDNNNLTSTFLVKHPAYFSINITGTTGAVVWANFTAPSTIGSYQFFCQIPGHFPSGMEGFLGVGISVGGAPAPMGLGLPVFLIAGTVVGLVILALVLGFVVGQREGPRHAMPAERLGYPEEAAHTPPAGPPTPPTPPR